MSWRGKSTGNCDLELGVDSVVFDRSLHAVSRIIFIPIKTDKIMNLSLFRILNLSLIRLFCA